VVRGRAAAVGALGARAPRAGTSGSGRSVSGETRPSVAGELGSVGVGVDAVAQRADVVEHGELRVAERGIAP